MNSAIGTLIKQSFHRHVRNNEFGKILNSLDRLFNHVRLFLINLWQHSLYIAMVILSLNGR